MKLVVAKGGLRIVPENEQDEAYIEDTLGLHEEGDKIALMRIAPAGLRLALAYLEARGASPERTP